MAYCSKCGVEVEEARKTCPLCDTPIHHYEDEKELSALWPVQKELPTMKKRTKHLLTVLPVLTVLVIAFLVIIIVDFRMNGTITWSRYPLTAVGGSFSMILGIVLFNGINILSLGWITAVTLIMLYLLDLFQLEHTWFESIGVPVTLLTAVYGELSLVAARLWGRKFAPQVTAQSLLITVLCLGLDFVVSNAFGREPFTWSIIVAVPLLVLFVSGLLSITVLHRYIDFEKYLHR